MATEFDPRPDTTPPGIQDALDKTRMDVASLINCTTQELHVASFMNLFERRYDPSMRPYWVLLEEFEAENGGRKTQLAAIAHGRETRAHKQPTTTETVKPARRERMPADGPMRIMVIDTYPKSSNRPYGITEITTRYVVNLGGDSTVDLSAPQIKMFAYLAAENRKGTYVPERELDKYAFAGHKVTSERMHAVRRNLLAKVNEGRETPLIDLRRTSSKRPAELGIIGQDVVFIPNEHFPILTGSGEIFHR